MTGYRKFAFYTQFPIRLHHTLRTNYWLTLNFDLWVKSASLNYAILPIILKNCSVYQLYFVYCIYSVVLFGLLKAYYLETKILIQYGFHHYVCWLVMRALLFHVSYDLLINISNNITTLPYHSRSMLIWSWRKFLCFINYK